MLEDILDLLRIYTNAMNKFSIGDINSAKLSLDLAKAEIYHIMRESSKELREVFIDWISDIEQYQKDISSKRTKVSLESVLETDNNSNTNRKDVTFQSYQIPTTTFEEIAGLENVKEEVKLKAIFAQKYPDLYKMFNKRQGGGILLYGPPGTGKTMIAEAIAHETKAKFFPITGSDISSKWFGDSEKRIRRLFEEANEQENALIFFDEVESYTNKRREGVMSRIVPELLAQMQGVGSSKKNKRILFVAATNKPWEIDSAFLRPGRFDERIYVPLPDRKARETIINLRLKDIPCEEDIDKEKLLNMTEGYNGADVDYLCEKAKAIAINEIIALGRKNQKLSMQDFIKALSKMSSSVRVEDIEKLKAWNVEYSTL